MQRNGDDVDVQVYEGLVSVDHGQGMSKHVAGDQAFSWGADRSPTLFNKEVAGVGFFHSWRGGDYTFASACKGKYKHCKHGGASPEFYKVDPKIG